MALTTQAQVAASANSVVQIANELKSFKILADEYSVYNGQTDPGWGSITNGNHPELVDSNGFIIGTNPLVKPADVSNAIASLNAFLALYKGTTFNFGTGSITPNSWGNSIEIVSSPLV